MHFGVLGLLLVVALLSFAAFQGVWKFRTLTKNIRAKSVELPLVADLNLKISQLRSVLWEENDFCSTSIAYQAGEKMPTVPVEFTVKCGEVEEALDKYYRQLVQTGSELPNTSDAGTGDSKELMFVTNFRKRLDKIKRDHRERNTANQCRRAAAVHAATNDCLRRKSSPRILHRKLVVCRIYHYHYHCDLYIGGSLSSTNL